MKMRPAYRILALFMAFTVVTSTTGVAISKHICDNEVKKIAINHNPDPCIHKQEPVTITCSVHGEMTLAFDDNDDCCKETTDYYKDDNPKNLNVTEIAVQPQFFVLSIFIFPEYNVDFQGPDYSVNKATSKIPPLLNQDIPILVQSFLL